MTYEELALAIWQEQLDAGYGYPGEKADPANLDDWLANRTYSLQLLKDAAAGDINALAEVREEAGLPFFV